MPDGQNLHPCFRVMKGWADIQGHGYTYFVLFNVDDKEVEIGIMSVI